MPGKPCLRRYLEMVAEQHNQICDALHDDKNSAELARACKKWKEGFWPPDGKTTLLLNEWDQSDVLHALYRKAFAELVQANLIEYVQTSLENIHARHKEVLAAALVLFESEANWMVASKWKGTWLARPGDIRPDDTEFKRASAAARTAWYELDSFVLGVEAKLKGHKSPATGKIEVSTPPPERLTFDEATMTITLDGKQFENIKPKAYRIVKLLWERLGQETLGDLIRKDIKGLQATNAISEAIKTLPKEIEECVKSDTRNGYWLKLPKR